MTQPRLDSQQKFKNVLIIEDVSLCENVQRGLRSPGYHQGRFVVDRSQPSFSEHHVHFFQSFVQQALINDQPVTIQPG